MSLSVTQNVSILLTTNNVGHCLTSPLRCCLSLLLVDLHTNLTVRVYDINSQSATALQLVGKLHGIARKTQPCGIPLTQQIRQGELALWAVALIYAVGARRKSLPNLACVGRNPVVQQFYCFAIS